LQHLPGGLQEATRGRDVAVKIFVASAVSPDGCIQEEMGISCSVDNPNLTKVLALVVQPDQEGSSHGGVGGVVLPEAAGAPGDVVRWYWSWSMANPLLLSQLHSISFAASE